MGVPEVGWETPIHKVMAALYNGLALAPQPDSTIGGITHPELLSQAYNVQVVAVADE